MNDNPTLRLGIMAVVGLSLFAALFARLWFLQVLAADEYELAASRNSVQVISEAAPRGRILDRNGNVLVDNRASNVVAVARSEVEPDEVEPLLQRLAPIVGRPVEELRDRYDDPTASRYVPVPLADDVSDAVVVTISERAEELPGVVAKRVAVRTYPSGNVAPHVLGYVGEINQEELDASENDYLLGDIIGKAGVEKAYESDLRGVPGEVRIEVDANNEPVRILPGGRPPQPGYDVVLSLDLDAQRVAERSLEEGLVAARERRYEETDEWFRAPAGAVVVLDAQAGTVIAMASYPTFDLPALADGISPEEAAILFPQEGDDRAAAFTNRAISGGYEPGSTWKLVTALAGLERGLITARSTVNDRGTFRIPGRCEGKCDFRNAGGAVFGPVDLPRALTVSSDVYFYDLGYRFFTLQDGSGETAIQETAAALGFGERTGVPLPGEAPGLVITPELRAQRFEERPDLFQTGDWFPGDNINLAIGQGELVVTPLQLANAYSTFANGGQRLVPNVVLRIEERLLYGGPRVVREIETASTGRIDLPQGYRDPLIQGLLGVTRDPRGTAYNAFAGWPETTTPVAGKTGTAQGGGDEQDTALFAAFAPANGTQYSISVVMEQAGFGATSAAPVARAVLGQVTGAELPAPVQIVSGGSG